MIKSDATNEIAAALAKAQGTIQPPQKNRTATVTMKDNKGKYTFNYCDLSDVIESVRGPLAANGISVCHSVVENEKGFLLETTLFHVSGQFLGTTYPLNLNGNAQANGSEITYARRYSLSMLVGVAAEEDDDGNGASGNDARITQRTPPRQNDVAGRRQETRQERATAPAGASSEETRVELATTEQVGEIKALLSVVKLPKGVQEKWFKAIDAAAWEDFPSDKIAKCIEYTKARLPQIASV